MLLHYAMMERFFGLAETGELQSVGIACSSCRNQYYSGRMEGSHLSIISGNFLLRAALSRFCGWIRPFLLGIDIERVRQNGWDGIRGDVLVMHAVTWNVGETAPPSTKHLRTSYPRRQNCWGRLTFVAVSLQEVPKNKKKDWIDQMLLALNGDLQDHEHKKRDPYVVIDCVSPVANDTHHLRKDELRGKN